MSIKNKGAFDYYHSLCLSGAIASFFVGAFTFSSGIDYTLGLLSFYFSSSYFTKVGGELKESFKHNFKKNGQRNALQVFFNGGIGTIICAIILFVPSLNQENIRILKYCYLCNYCVCNGDTWASEVGTAFGGSPILISNCKRVPPGTNGGVSPLGLLVSFLGGVFVAICFYYGTIYVEGLQIFNSIWEAIIIGGLFGFLGSIIDSILGATMQETLYSTKLKQIV